MAGIAVARAGISSRPLPKVKTTAGSQIDANLVAAVRAIMASTTASSADASLKTSAFTRARSTTSSTANAALAHVANSATLSGAFFGATVSLSQSARTQLTTTASNIANVGLYQVASTGADGMPSSGMVARYRADSVQNKNTGDAVTAWPEMFGTYPMSPYAGASASPTYVASAINGQPAIRFNYNTALQSALSSVQPRQTIVAVARWTDNGNPLTIRGATANGGLQFRIDSGKPDLVRQGQADLGNSGTAAAINTWHGLLATFVGTADSNSGASYRVDGAKQNVVNYADALSTSSLTSVFGMNGSGNGEGFSGDIAEILIWNRDLSQAEQTSVSAYIWNRYGLTMSDTDSTVYDPFTLASGTFGSPRYWTAGGTLTAANKKMQMVTGTSAYNSTNVSLDGMRAYDSSFQDITVTISGWSANTNTETYFGLFLCNNTTGYYTNDAYVLEIGSSNTYFAINEKQSGQSQNTVAYSQDSSIVALMSSDFRVRFQLSQGTLRAKFWAPGTVEPSSWQMSGAVTRTGIKGKPGWAFSNGNDKVQRTLYVDDVVAASVDNPPLTLVDNGNGTYTYSGLGVADGGDGTFVLNGSQVTDNGNGTWNIELLASSTAAATVSPTTSMLVGAVAQSTAISTVTPSTSTAVAVKTVSVQDNGDGTYAMSGSGVSDSGDGTYVVTAPATDNGDGTYTIYY